jgi:two-component system nitrate/nitrite response regulator NarL
MNQKARVAQGRIAALEMQDASNSRQAIAPTAIWLASSCASLKERLLSALRERPDISVLGHCAADDSSLATQLAEQRPDLLLIDWLGTNHPDRAPSVLKYYAALAPYVLLLVATPTASLVEGILKHRLHGYLRFDSTVDECARAIKRVRQGEVWIPRSKLAAALAELLWQRDTRSQVDTDVSATDTSLSPFTTREQQIVILVREGMTNKQIGRELGIAEDTVKKHLQNIYDKIGVRRRALLVVGGRPENAESILIT